MFAPDCSHHHHDQHHNALLTMFILTIGCTAIVLLLTARRLHPVMSACNDILYASLYMAYLQSQKLSH